ncbi:MAG: peptidyl-tRNA hydrolase Pth2 [Candidatus Bathyarchaeota archaeon]|nr:peptidyl-tRNA hydrolase Pth2 [Candidatus Bathyarchaeota archaeon]
MEIHTNGRRRESVLHESEFRFKQVIAVRTDLQMGKGKLAAQVGHAAVSAAENARRFSSEWWEEWLKEGQCKVVVKVSSLELLLNLREQASQKCLPFSLIKDRGITQLPPNTVTCLGIGPAPSEDVDRITSRLALL